MREEDPGDAGLAGLPSPVQWRAIWSACSTSIKPAAMTAISKTALSESLQMVLSDPEFVYRTEKMPATVKPGSAVSHQRVGTRDRGFPSSCGAAPPDDDADQPRDPKQAACEHGRPSQAHAGAIPRPHNFTVNFAGQWLQLRNLNGFAPIGDIYPDFDDNLRQAFKTEAEMFFESILKEESQRGRVPGRQLHIRERSSGAPLRHSKCLRQPLPPR